MLANLLLTASLAAVPAADQGSPRVEVHEQLESSAQVAASVRLTPLAGRLEIREGAPDGSWLPADSKVGERWVSRHRFQLDYDPASARLLLHAWSRHGAALALERPIRGALAAAAPNILRIEVANFDANASVRLEGLQLRQGDRTATVRDFGRGTMTSDLATVWAPSLAEGFELTGTLRVEGAVRPDSARVWIDFGLGTARRVEVAIEGDGWLRSAPPGLSAAPGDKRAVGLFAPGTPVRLEALEDPALRMPFRGWNDGTDDRPLSLPPDGGTLAVSARFDSAGTQVQPAAPALPVVAPAGGPYVFSNVAAVTIPAGAPATTSGPAGPYPSTITVSGPIGGAITDVNVTLPSVSHSFPDDLDILVVSPYGDTVLLMSDACGGENIVNFNWTFDDQAAAPMNDADICAAFFYQPTNFGDGDTFAAPAPTGPYGSTLSRFNSENPNGTWRLFVVDDAGGDVGALNQGWRLTIATEPYQILIPATGTSGIADPYPSIRVVSATNTLFGAILDANVVLSDMTHQHGDDLDILVVAPGGAAAVLMSDACGSEDFLNYFWRFDDEAPAPMSDNTLDGCNPFDVQPTNYGLGDTWPAPAPAGTFPASLAALDGQSGTGIWALFVNDDVGGDVGFLETDWFVELTLDGLFRDDHEL